jgi:hypothetical protein
VRFDTQVSYEIAPDPAATGLRSLASSTKWSLSILNIFDKEPSLISDAQSFYNRDIDPRQRHITLKLRKNF